MKQSLLEKLDFVIYAADKKEIVATQGIPCNKLYVLFEGKLRTDIIDGLDNGVMIEYIIAPRTFAIADYLNVTRPALSKKINKMIKEGLITAEGKTHRDIR